MEAQALAQSDPADPLRVSAAAEAQADADPFLVFDEAALERRADVLADAYRSAAPFPHTVIDDFLPRASAERILAAFPRADDGAWLDWRKRDVVHQPGKLGIGHADRLNRSHTFLRSALSAFNSTEVVSFLERLTGIQGLVPDPHFFGGGVHQILPGGRLSIHADFNWHGQLRLYRRVNLLLYLNKDWDEAWGGALELWDREMNACALRVAPIFNRAVIFNTDRDALHGHPDPLLAPDGVTRKSLALYYYTAEGRPEDLEARSTLWRLRPGEVEREG